MFFCLFFLQHTQTIVDRGTASLLLSNPHCVGVIARTNESQVVFLPYINKKFNLFIATFRTNIFSFVYFSHSTPKLQSIEAQHLLLISPCLCVIARTNESQVAFVPYINKIFNLVIAIFRSNISSSLYFSYNTPKL